MTAEELAAGAEELAKSFLGWHPCGALVRRDGHCPNCGPVAASGDCLLLAGEWVQWVERIRTQLDQAQRQAGYKARVRRALEEGAQYRKERNR